MPTPSMPTGKKTSFMSGRKWLTMIMRYDKTPKATKIKYVRETLRIGTKSRITMPMNLPIIEIISKMPMD